MREHLAGLTMQRNTAGALPTFLHCNPEMLERCMHGAERIDCAGKTCEPRPVNGAVSIRKGAKHEGTLP